MFRPKRLLAIVRHFKLTRKYDKKNISIGFYSSIINSQLDEYVWIGEQCKINNCHLGKHTYLNSKVNIRNAEIGSFCSIGSNVSINIGKHPTNLISSHPAFYSNNKCFQTFSDKMYFDEYGKVTIGNDVWIGSNVTIMGDIRIGNGAIVAYGAIVTKDVPPYAIVGGIPARVLKYRFDENTIKELLEIKWWELSDEFLKRHFKLFHDQMIFIEFYNSNKDYVESYRIKEDNTINIDSNE